MTEYVVEAGTAIEYVGLLAAMVSVADEVVMPAPGLVKLVPSRFDFVPVMLSGHTLTYEQDWLAALQIPLVWQREFGHVLEVAPVQNGPAVHVPAWQVSFSTFALSLHWEPFATGAGAGHPVLGSHAATVLHAFAPGHVTAVPPPQLPAEQTVFVTQALPLSHAVPFAIALQGFQ